MSRAAPILAIVVLVATPPALAQQSASYRLDETVLNQGRAPQAGTPLQSASYRVSLASLGDPLGELSLASPGLLHGVESHRHFR